MAIVDSAVLSEQAERGGRGTLLASCVLPAGVDMSGNMLGPRNTRAAEPAPAGRPEVMSLLAALVLAAASARVESVSLTTVDSRLAVRVVMSGTPGEVAVHREGDVARVSIMDAELGLRFAGGRRFSWTPSDGFDPALLAATPARLDRLEIAASASEVSLLLHVPPEVPVDVRRDPRGLLVVFAALRPPSSLPRRPGGRAAAHGRAACPGAAPVAVATTDTAELAKRLFPDRSGRGPGRGPGIGRRALPPALPGRRARGDARGDGGAGRGRSSPGRTSGVAVGPFRVRASVDARYVDADTFVESQAEPTRDNYLEVQPRVAAVAPVGEGRFTLDYAPVFRAFATYDDVNSSSHSLGAGLDLPIGTERDPPRPGPLPQRRPRHAGGGPRRGVLLRPRPLPPERRRRGR